MLLLVIGDLVKESLPAMSNPGLKEMLSGTDFSGAYTTSRGVYGLVPAIWGTLLVVVIALGIALPASLAVAVFSTEFRAGFLGKGMEAIMGALSGIPPIVYALMSVVFAEAFIRPKFGAPDMARDALPNGLTLGLLPWDQSTLLGGLLLSLVIVPFMAPLICDAIRNVPQGLREASLGLGANRWQTLKRIVIPAASPGIFSAVTLGALKACGDVIIVAWAIGYESLLPNPLLDLWERTPSLAAVGAGLAGGIGQTGGTYCSVGKACSVSYFSGLLLLLLAVAILGAATVLQRRLQRSFAQ
jgi:phosphate transport system permease protein